MSISREGEGCSRKRSKEDEGGGVSSGSRSRGCRTSRRSRGGARWSSSTTLRGGEE